MTRLRKCGSLVSVFVLTALAVLAWPAATDLPAQEKGEQKGEPAPPLLIKPGSVPNDPVAPGVGGGFPGQPGLPPGIPGSGIGPLQPGGGLPPGAAPDFRGPPGQAIVLTQPVPPLAGPGMPGGRFQFTINANTPLKDLLPVPPKTPTKAGLYLGESLAGVPEVMFQEPPAKATPVDRTIQQTAHQIAKIHFLNAKKTDAFMEKLVGQRPDLAGLPLTLGEKCRHKGDQARLFQMALQTVRNAMNSQVTVPISEAHQAPARAAQIFWQIYLQNCMQEDTNLQANNGGVSAENFGRARVAALMQVCGPETAAMRRGLIKYLAGVSNGEATRALARLAIFSAEDEVRQAALDALKVRRERDYTDVLTDGLRYPWPAVAQRSAEAVVKLERTDLLPQLADLLDEPDPRAPKEREADGKKETVVRELVKINHHRNCLLCHAPANPGNMPGDVVTAEVPIPGQPLPSFSQGYQQNGIPDILVRVDVTYVRQDFSMLLPVADAHPWPELQRFDFVVRTRTVTEKEAEAARTQLARHDGGGPSPYRRAALAALRELTGRDAGTTAEAWRRELKASK